MKILIASLILFMACTTIDTSKGFWGNPAWIEPHNGMDDGNPASINPPCEIVTKGHRESTLSFGMRLARQARWHQKHKHTVTEIRIIFHANDGLNWKRGDIAEAIIYYEETDGN